MNSIQVPSSPTLLVKKSSSCRGSKTFPSLKCKSSSSYDNEFKEQQVQELLTKKENKFLLTGLEKASQRVELAKREPDFIHKQAFALKQYNHYVNHLEAKAVENVKEKYHRQKS